MWIKNARILDPASHTDLVGDLHIVDGLIKAIHPGGTDITDDETIDARGRWVIPGLIDMHVHLREPGFEYKEDIESGTAAAAAGGVTTVVCMANTDPVNDNPAVTRTIVDKAAEVSPVRVLPVGAATKGLKGEELAEMGLMKQAGIIAVSDDGRTIQNAAVFRRALEYAASFGLPMLSHCQDDELSRGGAMNEGELSARLGIPGIPSAAEDTMTARDILIAEYAGLPIHITHLSTWAGLQIIRDARARGVAVTCDVTPHHLLLTEELCSTYDTNTKMYPPLRREDDRLALIEGLRDGIVDCIVTDHAPHAWDEKAHDFVVAPPGIIGLQTLLPSLLELQRACDLDLLELLKRVTCIPADLLGIDGGRIEEGARADLAIIDPETPWTLTEDQIRSKSHNTPFIGHTFPGHVTCTIVEGRIVYREL